MSVLRHPIRPIIRSPITSVLGQVGSLVGSATAYLAGNQPYHWFDFVNDRALYQGSDVGALSSIPGYSFSRASTGYYTNADGTLTSFASGALRRGDRGVLIEGARTNLLLRSQEFDSASWTAAVSGTGVAAVVTANAGTAPDGTTTADRIQLSLGAGTTASDISTLSQSYAGYTSGTPYTFTIWFKSNTGADQTILLVNFNSQSAAVTVTSSWQRFTWLVTPGTTTTSSAGIRIRGTFADGPVDVLAWGAQLEAASFASSYIPTTSASVTRAADILTLDLLNPNAYNVSGQPELVTNGGFDADTDWTKGTGVTIAAGVATWTASTGTLLQNITTALVAGTAYVVEFTVSGYSAGLVTPRFTGGSPVIGTAVSANGTYRQVLIAVADADLRFDASGSTTLNIDNVSLKAVPTSQQTTYPLTLWAEFERAVDTGGNEVLLATHATSSDIADIRVANSDVGQAAVTAASASQGTSSVSGAIAINTTTKLAARIATNDVAACRDGTVATPDATVTLPSAPTTITVGTWASAAAPAFGYIRRAAVLQGGLADANLQAIAP